MNRQMGAILATRHSFLNVVNPGESYRKPASILHIANGVAAKVTA